MLEDVVMSIDLLLNLIHLLFRKSHCLIEHVIRQLFVVTNVRPQLLLFDAHLLSLINNSDYPIVMNCCQLRNLGDISPNHVLLLIHLLVVISDLLRKVLHLSLIHI